MPDIGVRLEIKHGKDGFTGTVGCINIQDGIIKLEQ
jgi:hypothetical protein